MAPTTRSLRSNTELDDKPFAPLPSIPKKRKASEIAERIPCFSCADDKLSKQFPDFNPTPDCDHLINTCKKCLRLWIEASVDGTNFKSGGEDGKLWGIQCPQCDCIMRGVNVQDGSTKKIGKR